MIILIIICNMVDDIDIFNFFENEKYDDGFREE